jgi:hypothetical protein
VQAIGASLVKNTSLTTLYLGSNRIGDTGAQAIGDEEEKAINDLLSRNKNLLVRQKH